MFNVEVPLQNLKVHVTSTLHFNYSSGMLLNSLLTIDRFAVQIVDQLLMLLVSAQI